MSKTSLVTELTEKIKTREGDEDGNHLNKYFPDFFLVLRDFFLDMTLDGKPCTPKEYLENALKTKPGMSRQSMEYNAPRQCIRHFFPERMCFTLCKPVDDDAKIRQLDRVPESEIKREFLIKAKEAVDTILRAAKPFEVDGNPINGSRLFELARTYVDVMNNNGIPCIANAVELLKVNECQRALEQAVIVFDEYMRESVAGKLPVEVQELEAKQKTAHNAALEQYHKSALFDDDQGYLKKLAGELENKYQVYIRENDKISTEKCKVVLQESFKVVDWNMRSGAYVGGGGYVQYKADREKAIRQYRETPKKGPMAENMLNNYLESRKSEEEAIINADKALSKKEKELAKAAEEKRRQEEKTQLAEAEQKRLMQDFIRQQNEHKEMVLKMQTDYEDRQNKMREEYAKDMDAKEAEYKRLMSEGLNQQAEQYKILISDMKQDREKLEQQHTKQMEQMQAYKEQHTALLEEMKEQRKVSAEQMERMQQQIINLQNTRSPDTDDSCCIL